MSDPVFGLSGKFKCRTRREASGAFRAARPIEDILRPAEALFGQGVVQPSRGVALQSGKQLPLHAPFEIGAGLRGRHVKLGRNGESVPHRPEDRIFRDVSKWNLARQPTGKGEAGLGQRSLARLIMAVPKRWSWRPWARLPVSINTIEASCSTMVVVAIV